MIEEPHFEPPRTVVEAVAKRAAASRDRPFQKKKRSRDIELMLKSIHKSIARNKQMSEDRQKDSQGSSVNSSRNKRLAVMMSAKRASRDPQAKPQKDERESSKMRSKRHESLETLPTSGVFKVKVENKQNYDTEPKCRPVKTELPCRFGLRNGQQGRKTKNSSGQPKEIGLDSDLKDKSSSFTKRKKAWWSNTLVAKQQGQSPIDCCLKEEYQPIPPRTKSSNNNVFNRVMSIISKSKAREKKEEEGEEGNESTRVQCQF